MRILIVGDNPLSLFFSSIFYETSEIILFSERKQYSIFRERKGATLKSRISEYEFDIDAVTSNPLDLVGESFDAILFTGGPAKVFERLKNFSENSITTDFYILNCDGLLIEGKVENIIPKHSSVARFITDMRLSYNSNTATLEILREENIYAGYTIKGKSKAGILDELIKTMREKYYRVTFLEDMNEYIWKRGIIIASAESLTAVLGIKMKFLLESVEARELLQNLIREGERIARKTGINITNLYREALIYIKKHGDEEPRIISRINDYSPEDIEFFNGAIIDVSKKYNMDAVYNEIIYKLLKARESIIEIS